MLIHEDFRDYLGFSFVHKGIKHYARYICACFGLRDIPYVFTKMFRPLIKHWRACGMRVVQFLDDGFGCFRNQTEAQLASVHIREDLLRAGAIWSIKKCQWVPVQRLEC